MTPLSFKENLEFKKILTGTEITDIYKEFTQFIRLGGFPVITACVATGNDFPDALAGSLYAAKNNAAIILSDEALTDSEITYLKTKKVLCGTIFGGEGVVSKYIEEQLNQILEK